MIKKSKEIDKENLETIYISIKMNDVVHLR